MKRALVAALIALAAPAFAQDAPPEASPSAAAQVRFPQLTNEIDMALIGVGTPSSTDPTRRGGSVFLFGDIDFALALTENFSIQLGLATEPIGEGDSTGGFPDGGIIGFRRQALFIEQFHAEWKPDPDLALRAGTFVAPFGRGYHDFPGILVPVRAHEAYLFNQLLGVNSSWTWLDDPRFGTHEVTGFVYALDRSFLSTTLITPRSCCNPRYERYSRNTARQGGPGNDGSFDSFALALDGENIPGLEGFSYHFAVLSQAPGTDGTAREWGYAASLFYDHRWNAEQSTMLFAEGVQFRNAGGRPRIEVPTTSTDPATGTAIDSMTSTTLSERQTFFTIGVRHSIGPWRASLAWQQWQRKRSIEPVPNENWIEVSVGRDLGRGFGIDLGYQYARQLTEEGPQLGTSHSILARLVYRGSLF
ncbi:hypothetical protein AAFN86_20900 [Roseomonas sp. CAU 1739]|uniref:hypothetical protein n=1 Tax=Roseomonas sp. CAU 1739 TaxID=3140364 RepID=UPI00325B8464